MAQYKIHGLFDDECPQMVPVDTYTENADIYQQNQWSPYSGMISDTWDLSPASVGGDESQSVPVYGRQQQHSHLPHQPLQAYTFDGQLIKPEPTTLLDCLKAPLACPTPITDQYNCYQQKINHVEDARVKMEETCRLAQQIAYSDVSKACQALRISADPIMWSVQNTRDWLLWTCEQYKEYGLSAARLDKQFFNIDGLTLTLMTEADFKETPFGECIMWALEIWRGASQSVKMETTTSEYPMYQYQMSSPAGNEQSEYAYSTGYAGSVASSGHPSYGYDTLSVSSPGSIPDIDSGIDGNMSENGDIECFGDLSSGPSTGSHTHLWQFLKEMLANPRFKSAIRWTDRAQGIFKIDDSALVARKWGERKHRPAMNYDKLSRSIRQYYKKGIMKKTARSQRLVYQFCSHYAN